MNGVQTRFKCKLDVKRCKRFVFPPSSLLPRSNALKTKAIRYFQTDRTLTRIVSPPLFVLCLFFISTVSFAQKEIAPTKNLDAYIGTWMYQSNDTIFKIVLKKGYAEDQHMIINGLMGGYFLSVKGIIVENYFSIRDTIWHLDKKKGTQDFSIWASNNATSLDYIDPNRVGVLFYDQRKKHFGGKGILGGKILLLSSDKIRWHLDEKLGLALEEPDEYTELIGFSVPSDVIMTKEKEQ